MHAVTDAIDATALLKQHRPLVRRLAHQMMNKLPANVEIDDLIQVGMMGLSEALTRFDAEQGVQFETFASQRIRGAMLDELRGSDWMSRGDRKMYRSMDQAIHRLEHELGRVPSDGEVAQAMDLPLATYQSLMSQVRGTQIVYLEDMSGDEDVVDFLDRHVVDHDSDPQGQLEEMQMRRALVDAIRHLPEREKQVMSVYYEHDLSLKEMAATLGVTDSRACQLHAQAVARLRGRLRTW